MLMGKLLTLKLDAAWQPIEVITAEKAFSMVYSGRAQVVENYKQGPCAHFHFPSVIVLKKYVRKRKVRMSATRKNIYWRDKYTCQYCGGKFSHGNLTLDHVVPRSRGGLGGWENLVSACVPCNQKKGCKTPYEASMKLIKEPKEPRATLMDFFHHMSIPETWQQFISNKERT